MSTSNDFLLGGGSKSAKFENIGDSISGTIVTSEVKQQTDIATGALLTWDNNDPRMQLVVTLQTDLHDDNDDDGQRSIYVKGSKKSGTKSLHDAVAQAVRDAGARGIEPDGTLSVTYTGTEPSATRGFNDRKLYKATYKVPDKAAASGDFLLPGDTTQPSQPTPEQVAALKAAGVDVKTVYPQWTP